MSERNDDDVVVDFNQAKQKRQWSRQKPQEDKEQDYQDLLEAARGFLDKDPMWYVRKQGVYYKRRMDGTPIFVKPSYLANGHTEWNAKFAKAVTVVLDERGHLFNDVTYAFSEVQSDLLNLMDKSLWIQPKAGEYHPVFDWITHSAGGGKPEAVDHIRHCIVHKYLHPEDYTLPAMVIYGEGGAGKNVLINKVLKRLYAGKTMSSEATHVTGQFNALIAGMVIVMIDESMADKTSGQSAKLIVGNSEFIANPKGLQAFQCENTGWYWIGSNEKENGGIWLDRSKADRRYSVIHIEDGLTLEYWIAVRHGWLPPHDYSDDQYDAATKRAYKWLKNEGLKHLCDPEQIAAWLESLIQKYGEHDAPRALHGEDYKRLLGIQERMYDRIIAAVFADPDFTHICKTALYAGYEACSKKAGEKGKILDRVLFDKVRVYLKKHKMDGYIIEDRPRQDTGRHIIWKDNRKPEHIFKIDNTKMRYVDDYGRWIGPEV
jgi:hypothetical protein